MNKKRQNEELKEKLVSKIWARFPLRKN